MPSEDLGDPKRDFEAGMDGGEGFPGVINDIRSPHRVGVEPDPLIAGLVAYLAFYGIVAKPSFHQPIAQGRVEGLLLDDMRKRIEPDIGRRKFVKDRRERVGQGARRVFSNAAQYGRSPRIVQRRMTRFWFAVS